LTEDPPLQIFKELDSNMKRINWQHGIPSRIRILEAVSGRFGAFGWFSENLKLGYFGYGGYGGYGGY
jgi:hypothetical protein